MPGRRTMPPYVIINDTDRPMPEMVCQWVPGVGYCYLDRSGNNPSFDGMKGREATPVEEFGLGWTNTRSGAVRFYRSGAEPCAKYQDGEPRIWQSQYWAFEYRRLRRADVKGRD